jgi:Thioredoxin
MTATVATAVALVAAVIAVTSSLGPASGYETTTRGEINALLAGIPQSGNTLGSPTAPATLQYFGDLECATARAFTLGVLPSIIHRWVRSGKLRIEYRSLRSVSEPKAFGVQQVAALAAGAQDKAWYYIEDFYLEQGEEHTGYVTENYLSTVARQVPSLNLEQWRHDRHDPQLATQVAEDAHAAHTAHLHSTPSFLVGPTGSVAIFSGGQFATANTVNQEVERILYAASTADPPGEPQSRPRIAAPSVNRQLASFSQSQNRHQ